MVLSLTYTKMEYICKYNRFGYCKLKDQCKKYHINEECKEGLHCENINECPLRHPKFCKKILLGEHCRFEETCAYNHKSRSNYQNNEINTMQEEVKTLNAEIDTLKMNFKYVLSIRAEVESLDKSVKYIKEEIHQLKATNTDIAERLKHVEEDINDETDDECDSEIDLNLSQLKNKLTCKHSQEKKGQDLKCDKCDFVGDSELSMSKHTNIRHPLQKTEDKEINSARINCNIEGIEGIEDLFQL